jgi:hypothetical protein
MIIMLQLKYVIKYRKRWPAQSQSVIKSCDINLVIVNQSCTLRHLENHKKKKKKLHI